VVDVSADDLIGWRPRCICIQLTGSDYDGRWWAMPPGAGPMLMAQPLEDGQPDVERGVMLVPTGSVVWQGDTPAEVFVPEGRLWLWRAEHEEA
jgi:hypothetical protein